MSKLFLLYKNIWNHKTVSTKNYVQLEKKQWNIESSCDYAFKRLEINQMFALNKQWGVDMPLIKWSKPK